MAIALVSSDLATYLGLSTIDDVRASQILALAESLCASIVNPLPAGAEPVVLDVASRAWNNPKGAQSSTNAVGSVSQSTSYPGVAGGLYLTRENKATLRRLTSGSSSIFTINILPDVAPALPWWDNGAITFGWEPPYW